MSWASDWSSWLRSGADAIGRDLGALSPREEHRARALFARSSKWDDDEALDDAKHAARVIAIEREDVAEDVASDE